MSPISRFYEQFRRATCTNVKDWWLNKCQQISIATYNISTGNRAVVHPPGEVAQPRVCVGRNHMVDGSSKSNLHGSAHFGYFSGLPYILNLNIIRNQVYGANDLKLSAMLRWWFAFHCFKTLPEQHFHRFENNQHQWVVRWVHVDFPIFCDLQGDRVQLHICGECLVSLHALSKAKHAHINVLIPLLNIFFTHPM